MKRDPLPDPVVDLPDSYIPTARTVAESTQRLRLLRATQWQPPDPPAPPKRSASARNKAAAIAWLADGSEAPPSWAIWLVAAMAVVAALVVAFGQPGWAIGGWLP